MFPDADSGSSVAVIVLGETSWPIHCSVVSMSNELPHCMKPTSKLWFQFWIKIGTTRSVHIIYIIDGTDSIAARRTRYRDRTGRVEINSVSL